MQTNRKYHSDYIGYLEDEIRRLKNVRFRAAEYLEELQNSFGESVELKENIQIQINYLIAKMQKHAEN